MRAVLEQRRLARRGVVEGQDDGTGAARQVDLPRHERRRRHRPVVVAIEPRELGAELVGREVVVAAAVG